MALFGSRTQQAYPYCENIIPTANKILLYTKDGPTPRNKLLMLRSNVHIEIQYAYDGIGFRVLLQAALSLEHRRSYKQITTVS